MAFILRPRLGGDWFGDTSIVKIGEACERDATRRGADSMGKGGSSIGAGNGLLYARVPRRG